MKTFKNVKEGEQIFSLDNEGNVIAYNITQRVEDWYEHRVTLYLSGLKDIRVNMDMYSWVGEDNTIIYFANKDDALSALREIAEKANKVIQNCLKSMDIFS